MSLNLNIPFSGQLTSTEDLQLRENSKGTSMVYFKLAVKEADKSNGKEKTHYLPFVVYGKKAENFIFAVRNGMITTRTRLSVVAGLDTYSKPLLDPSTNSRVDVLQVSFPVWDLGVSTQFAPVADVSSPAFQQSMNQGQQGGYQNQQGNFPAQQGGYQNQAPQQSQGGYQNQAPQQSQGGYQNQAPQQSQGGYQNQQGNYPAQQGGYQNQAPQEQNNAPAPQPEQPQQQAQGEFPSQPQAEQPATQGKSMRDEPLLDGEDF
ncbi:hypothetical protein ACTXM3_09240 [Glutamicibacter arilaitensis]|uniref:hypothetical protein n=1 Tax=Glutamicibacter arilaitensis TaxID=256701 RepID=UPI003FCF5DA2